MLRPHTPKYLVRRDRVYYFRIAVPTFLRARFGCHEFKASLQTKDDQRGRIYCRVLSNQFEHLFSKAIKMPELTQDQLQDIARSYFRELLIESNDFAFKIENDLMAPSDERVSEKANWIRYAAGRETKLRDLHQMGTAVDLFKPVADTLLINNGFVPDRSSDSHGILCQYIVRAQIEQQRVHRAKLEQNYEGVIPNDPLFSDIFDDTLPPLPEFGLGAPDVNKTIGELIEKYKAANAKSWKYKTSLDFERMLGCFSEWFGPQRPIKSITTPDMGTYRDVLISLPKRYKAKGKASLTLKEALKNPSGGELLKPQSAEKYLNLTRSFLHWCVDEGYIDKVPGKKISIEYTVDEKPRLSFEQQQLKALFKSPIWTGCRSNARRSRVGDVILENAYYWIPLMGVYTGMRCGEIVQLRHKDIRTFDNIPYIDVNDDHTKKLKTKYSNRRIPLHPALIKYGFLDFLQSRASGDGDERVFNEIGISKQGDPSHAYSKFFSRYLADVGIKNSQVSFHSFRHTFSDACDNASITDPQRKAMMGHSDGSASAQYGTGASIPVLFEAISRIVYDFETDFVPALTFSKTEKVA